MAAPFFCLHRKILFQVGLVRKGTAHFGVPSFIIFLTSILDNTGQLCYSTLTGRGHGRAEIGKFRKEVFSMDKDKILEKSRKENEKQDEMERTITIEGESFSLAFTLMAGLAIVVFNHFHNLSSDSVLIMFWTSCVSSRLYRLTKRKSTSDLITLIISLVILVFYMVKYFSQG